MIIPYKSKRTKLELSIQLKFILVQHCRDEELMNTIKDFLKCGNLLSNKETTHFIVSNMTDITNVIIPFFKKYPIMGEKIKDFSD